MRGSCTPSHGRRGRAGGPRSTERLGAHRPRCTHSSASFPGGAQCGEPHPDPYGQGREETDSERLAFLLASHSLTVIRNPNPRWEGRGRKGARPAERRQDPPQVAVGPSQQGPPRAPPPVPPTVGRRQLLSPPWAPPAPNLGTSSVNYVLLEERGPWAGAGTVHSQLRGERPPGPSPPGVSVPLPCPGAPPPSLEP